MTSKVDKQSQWNSYVPYAGIGIGSYLGSLSNLWNNGSFFVKDVVEKIKDGKTYFGSGPTCARTSYNSSILVAINDLKQTELRLALVTPFIPLIVPTAQLLSKGIAERDLDKPVYHAIPESIGREIRQISMPRAAYQGTLALGSFLVNAALKQISETPGSPFNGFYDDGSNFDPSNHVILKMALASCLVNSIRSANQTASKTQAIAWGVFAVIVAATDAVLMYNTGENCHAVAEMAAGFLVAGLLHAAASGVEKSIQLLQAKNAATQARPFSQNRLQSPREHVLICHL